MRRRPISVSLTATTLLSIHLSTTATAQDKDTVNEPIEEVLVTGSLLKRSLDKSSQLVTNIDAEQIRLLGFTTPVDVLATISQNSGSGRTSTTTASGGDQLANYASLRALGPESTLVLVNGRRVVKNPLKNKAVDFNSIPMAMLESIDVLSDGASSVYGSDAVAGVINLRMKDEVQGFHYYGYGLQPNDEGGEVFAGALSAGFGSLDEEGWNISVSGTWRERQRIRTLDRSFSETAVVPERGINNLLRQAFPSNVSQVDANGAVIVNNANPYPDCFPSVTVPFRGACGYNNDQAGNVSLQNPEEQMSFFGRFSTKLGEAEGSIEYFRTESVISSSLAPTTYVGLPVPPDSPYFPGAGTIPAIPGLDPTLPIRVASRWEPGGPRVTENETVTDRILAEIEGEAAGFGYELWALHSTSKSRLKMLNGAYLRAEFNAGFSGVNGVFLNPFGPATPEEQQYLDSIRVSGTLTEAEGTLSMAGVTLTRDLFELPAGTVSSALAFEYSMDEVDYERNPVSNLTIGAVIGGDQSVNGDRDQYSITGEVLVPVTDRFEINASLRYDEYSDFGNTTNPKIMLSYDISDTVNLHGSFNTGFRAPTLYNLVTPSAVNFIVGTLYDDPVLCPGGNVNTAAGGIDIRDCGQRFNTLVGGNPDLQPEESEAFTVGIDFQATDTLEFSLDYWNYTLDESIGPLAHTAIFGDPERFSNFLIRCSQADPVLAQGANGCLFGGGGDPLAYVVQTNANLGQTKTAGADFSAKWTTVTALGHIGINYNATYVDKFEFERVPGDPSLSRAGQFIDGFPVPRYTHFLAFNWLRDNWSAQLQNQFVSGYEDCNSQCRITPDFFNEVDDYSIWNLTVTHKFNDTLSVTAYVRNLFDTEPPFTNGGPLCATCDTRFSDPTGQSFGLSFSGSFGE